ncbi:MAG: hypothetical protein AAF587_29655 [Bacteroidota bacterium]
MPKEELYSKLCKVVSVDESEATCTVDLLDGGAPVEAVRLSASPSHAGLHVIPKVGSEGVITWLSKHQAYLALASDIDHIKIDVGQSVLQVDASGIVLSRGTESLAAILKDILTQINLITVSTPSGPSAVPNNVAAFSAISARIETLLKTS